MFIFLCWCIFSSGNIHASKNSNLRRACLDGNLKYAKIALNRGAEINSVNVDGDACLHLAAKNNHSLILKYLKTEMVVGLKYDIKNRLGETPLHVACLHGSTNFIMDLVHDTSLLEIRDHEQRTALHKAVEHGNIANILYLVARGAHMNAQDFRGNSPVHLACTRKPFAVLKALLWAKPDLNLKNDGGWTPLHLATRFGNLLSMVALIQNGADKDSTDLGCWTPLHVASYYNQLGAAALLVNEQAKVSINNNGKTPLAIAKSKEFTDLIELFESLNTKLSGEA